MTTILESPQSSRSRQQGGTGSVAGAVLAGVGALLFVVGLLVHFYVAPTLAVAPTDQNSLTHLEAKNATVFDTATLAPITTDLSIESHTVGDVASSKKAPGDTIVWHNNTTITSADGVIRSQSSKRAAFDAKTAAASKWGENWYETTAGDRSNIIRNGLMFKFPFNTEKKTYQVWDDTLGAPVTTSYTGTTKLQGHTVYTFENQVPASVVGTRELPPTLFGQPQGESVDADVSYQNHTTYYVEPVTGAIVNQISNTKSWFGYAGAEVVTTEAQVQYTQAQIKETFDMLGSQPTQLALAQGFVPWLVVVLGLGMIAFGTAISRRHQH